MTAAAADIVQQIRSADWRSELRDARRKYREACASMTKLGQTVRILPNEEKSSTVHYRLEAVCDIPADFPITAVPADAVCASIVSDAPVIERLAADGAHVHQIDGKWFMFGGPLAERATAGELEQLYRYCSAPVQGFEPIIAVIAEGAPEAEPTPDLAALYVEGVVVGDPFEGLSRSDEALDTWAQTSVAYLQKVHALANTNVEVLASGYPTVLRSKRAISRGETLFAGRPPMFWIRDRVFGEKIAVRLGEGSDALPGDDVRQMLGL
jgi:hypothetical protein